MFLVQMNGCRGIDMASVYGSRVDGQLDRRDPLIVRITGKIDLTSNLIQAAIQVADFVCVSSDNLLQMVRFANGAVQGKLFRILLLPYVRFRLIFGSQNPPCQPAHRFVG